MNYWEKYYFKMSIPFVFVFGIILGMLVYKVSRALARRKLVTFKIDWKPLWTIFNFINVTLFTFMVSNAVDPLNCTLQPDGSFSMTNNPSIQCFGALWNEKLPVMIFFLVTYGFIGPFYIVFSFWTNRHFPEREPFRSRFFPLMTPYKRRFFYWEIFAMFKRACFIISNNILSSRGASYATKFTTSVSILVFAMCLETLFFPYATKEYNTNSVA
jgi:hypothetical protein